MTQSTSWSLIWLTRLIRSHVFFLVGDLTQHCHGRSFVMIWSNHHTRDYLTWRKTVTCSRYKNDASKSNDSKNITTMIHRNDTMTWTAHGFPHLLLMSIWQIRCKNRLSSVSFLFFFNNLLSQYYSSRQYQSLSRLVVFFQRIPSRTRRPSAAALTSGNTPNNFRTSVSILGLLLWQFSLAKETDNVIELKKS